MTFWLAIFDMPFCVRLSFTDQIDFLEESGKDKINIVII